MITADYINIESYPSLLSKLPWEITGSLEEIIISLIKSLSSSDYIIKNNTAIHRSATIENGAIMKPPYIISSGCFVAATAYLRGGVFMGNNVIIGPSVEVKTSFFCDGGKAAHLNFVGDSVIGNNVNIEAGAMLANYKNESDDKQVYYKSTDGLIATGVEKFGALLGDGCKIGANAVLVPGTVLSKNTIVRRLELVDHMNATR